MGVLQRGPHRMIQAGPTNHGLADSGHGSLISLVQVTMALLSVAAPSLTIRYGSSNRRLRWSWSGERAMPFWPPT